MQMSACAGLTQFQLMEDSGPATQTQKAVTDAVTKSTLSMIGYSPLPLDHILTLQHMQNMHDSTYYGCHLSFL